MKPVTCLEEEGKRRRERRTEVWGCSLVDAASVEHLSNMYKARGSIPRTTYTRHGGRSLSYQHWGDGHEDELKDSLSYTASMRLAWAI